MPHFTHEAIDIILDSSTERIEELKVELMAAEQRIRDLEMEIATLKHTTRNGSRGCP